MPTADVVHALDELFVKYSLPVNGGPVVLRVSHHLINYRLGKVRRRRDRLERPAQVVKAQIANSRLRAKLHVHLFATPCPTSARCATYAPQRQLSVRAVSRITDTHIHTITDLMVMVGERCEAFSAEVIRGVQVDDVQCDEIWQYIICKNATAEQKSTSAAALIRGAGPPSSAVRSC